MAISLCNNSECTGCMACVNACNFNAIEIVQDKEGFYRPSINYNNCTECKACMNTCPVINPIDKHQAPLSIYSGWSTNEETRRNSSSGGAFTELAKEILKRKGVVFGVELNKEQIAIHSYITNSNELHKYQGSKYMQSYISPEIYIQVHNFLKSDRYVLFSGTPCQIAGLRKFLKHTYKNLITVDIICHGTPSPLIFNAYKNYIEEKENISIKTIKFRDKKYSWIFFNMKILGVSKKGNTKQYIGTYNKDPWIRGFLSDNFLQPACHKCTYTSVERVADITIADWWKYRPASNEKKDFFYKGVSLIYCNTLFGDTFFNDLKDHLYIRERKLEDSIKTNVTLKKAFPIPSSREEFWKDYHKHSFDFIKKKWMTKNTLSISQYLQSNFLNNRIVILLTQAINKLENILKLP